MQIALPYARNAYTQNTIHADTDDPDRFTVETNEDVTGVIDYCKEKREAMSGRTPDGLFHVAEVPLSIAEKAEQEGWTEADWKRWLNDPDNAVFRTWKGRV